MKSTQQASPRLRETVKTKEARTHEKVNNDMDLSVDSAMASLFNAVMETITDKSFRIRGDNPDLTRTREIVSQWKPQKYAPTVDPREFCTPYVLSKFFDRYLTVKESQDVYKLEAKATIKFINTCTEGWKYDAYHFHHAELKPVMDKMRYIVADVLGDFDLLDIYKRCKHGPNSTTEVPRLSSYLHVKDGVISGPRASIQQFIHYLHWDETLRRFLVEQSDELRALINGTCEIDPVRVVNSTRNNLVPKKFDSLRDMCPESTTPSYFGQGVGDSMAARLTKVGIDLKTQPDVHRALSRLGSKYPELNIATIDWSEASNRIWMALVEAVFTEGDCPKWYDFMVNVCRCENTTVNFIASLGEHGDFISQQALTEYLQNNVDTFVIKPVGREKSRVRVIASLKTPMIGTMGNAITFPLQTLIFYAFLTACTELHEERMNLHNTEYQTLQPVSCFGDDGILDSRVLPVVRVLSPLFGMKLNVDKSFTEGMFRESCGGDYFMGVGCRPVQMKRPPTNPFDPVNKNKKAIQAWLYIAANAVCDLVTSFGYGVKHIDNWLEQQHVVFGLGRICVVPPSYPDGSGLRIRDFVGPYAALFEETRCAVTFGVPYGLDTKKYHVPWFSCLEHAYVFRALSSQPHSFIPEQEYSYYCRALKGVGESNGYQPKVSFFDLTTKTLPTLDSDGKIPMKECRLHKVTATTLSWE